MARAAPVSRAAAYASTRPQLRSTLLPAVLFWAGVVSTTSMAYAEPFEIPAIPESCSAFLSLPAPACTDRAIGPLVDPQTQSPSSTDFLPAIVSIRTLVEGRLRGAEGSCSVVRASLGDRVEAGEQLFIDLPSGAKAGAVLTCRLSGCDKSVVRVVPVHETRRLFVDSASFSQSTLFPPNLLFAYVPLGEQARALYSNSGTTQLIMSGPSCPGLYTSDSLVPWSAKVAPSTQRQ